MTSFAVEVTLPLHLDRDVPLAEMWALNPLVWRQDGRYHLLVRAVSHDADQSHKVSRIYDGHGDDGLRFTRAYSAPFVTGLLGSKRRTWLPCLKCSRQYSSSDGADTPVSLSTPTPADELSLDRHALGFSPGRHVLSVVGRT